MSIPLIPDYRVELLTKALNHNGYGDVYYAPVRAFDGDGCVLLIVAEQNASATDFRERLELVKLDIHVLVEALDYVGGRKFPSTFRKKLSPSDPAVNSKVRELILLLVHQDLSLDQAAGALGVHINTIRRRIRALRKAYKAQNTHTAIYRAHKDGFFDRSEW